MQETYGIVKYVKGYHSSRNDDECTKEGPTEGRKEGRKGSKKGRKEGRRKRCNITRPLLWISKYCSQHQRVAGSLFSSPPSLMSHSCKLQVGSATFTNFHLFLSGSPSTIPLSLSPSLSLSLSLSFLLPFSALSSFYCSTMFLPCRKFKTLCIIV